MSKELNPSLKSLALQIALQLPDEQKEAISVLQYIREIVERHTRPRPRTSSQGAADRGEY
jgi:hypothetical protein